MRFFCFFLLFFSCAQHPTNQSPDKFLSAKTATYHFEDVSGKYILKRTSEYRKEQGQFVLKSELYSAVRPDKLMEKIIALAEVGYVKSRQGEKSLMRPKASQYSVWLEDKPYSVQSKLNTVQKTLDLVIRSPEISGNKLESVPVPRDARVYCYFSQLVECVRLTGFLDKAVKEKSSELPLKILWEGYPFFHEQYNNIPAGPFADAILRYEGITEKGEFAFQLEVAEHLILYHLDEKLELSKIFWIAQGLTVIRQN